VSVSILNESLESDAVTACPACGAAAASKLGNGASAFEVQQGGRTYHQPAYWIRLCADCGLCFKSHTVPPEVLDDYYDGLDFRVFDYEERLPTDRQLDRYLSRLPVGSRVLDFGCSTGRILRAHTSRLACFGVEPNLQAATIASDRGIAILIESELRDEPVRRFDAIIVADVYEHLLHPVQTLARLVEVLNPGGWLAIVSGNADAIRDRARIAEFWYFRTPSHLLMLTRNHLSWLARRLGLDLDGIHTCSHYQRPLTEWLMQHVRSAAYVRLRAHERGPMSRLLRTIPVLNRAARWTNAPVLDCGRDHVVAVLRRPVKE